ncbi:hypothetical protein ACSAZL_12550 [Methanosarcina sp. T3]|uniref:hypothetical protein n=1 Tax=Methanosarcina sp. T3 TaxID=3439062 RepID=UPI003F8639F5
MIPQKIVAYFPSLQFEMCYIVLFMDVLSSGILKLIQVAYRPEPRYIVMFSSTIPGRVWVAKESDYETALSTYSAVISDEFI